MKFSLTKTLKIMIGVCFFGSVFTAYRNIQFRELIVKFLNDYKKKTKRLNHPTSLPQQLLIIRLLIKAARAKQNIGAYTRKTMENEFNGLVAWCQPKYTENYCKSNFRAKCTNKNYQRIS